MELSLEAKVRTTLGKMNKHLRQGGQLPAVLYGKGQANLSLQISTRDFERVFRQAGESVLLNLKIEGVGERKVLIHDVAKNYLKDEPVHVDFYEADLTRKIRTKVPVHFEGVAPAVKELGGVLVKNLNELDVEALPQDLPPFIAISIENLKAFTQPIRISDLKLPDNIRLTGHSEDVIITVQAPRSEEELLELEKPVAEAEKAAIETMTKEQEAEKAEKTEGAAKTAEPPAKEAVKGEKKEEKKE